MARKTKITEHPTDSTGFTRARLICSSIPFDVQTIEPESEVAS